MSLAGLAILLSGVGIAVTGLLAVVFLRDPVRGMAQTTHRLDQLPQVMADRYVAFAFLALGATLSGDMAVIAWVFAAFAFMGFADAGIYARAGRAWTKHFGAGLAATLVVVVALAAMGAGE